MHYYGRDVIHNHLSYLSTCLLRSHLPATHITGPFFGTQPPRIYLLWSPHCIYRQVWSGGVRRSFGASAAFSAKWTSEFPRTFSICLPHCPRPPAVEAIGLPFIRRSCTAVHESLVSAAVLTTTKIIILLVVRYTLSTLYPVIQCNNFIAEVAGLTRIRNRIYVAI